MEIITLGKSGIQTSRFGLGMAALGRPGYINLGHNEDIGTDKSVNSMERNAHHMLDVAYGEGIRYFDAARSYGLAEKFLASWIERMGFTPDDITIGSKWGYTYTADWQVTVPAGTKHEVKAHTLPNFQKQLAESKAILGDYLKLYQIHSATLDSGVMENSQVLTALAQLKSQGIAIGFSVSGTGQSDTIYKALDQKIDGRPLFDTVQATYNLLETSASDALATAHSAGLGVIIKEGVANGRLTPRNTGSEIEELRKLAKEQNTTIDALALAGVLNQPFIDIVLSGAANPDHLKENIKAFDSSPPTFNISEPPSIYWQKRSKLYWQ